MSTDGKATSRRQPRKPSPNAIATDLSCVAARYVAARYHYNGGGFSRKYCRMPAHYRLYIHRDGTHLYWLIEDLFDEHGMTSLASVFEARARAHAARLNVPLIIEGTSPMPHFIGSRRRVSDEVLVKLMAARPEWRRVVAEFVLDTAAGCRPTIDRSKLP